MQFNTKIYFNSSTRPFGGYVDATWILYFYEVPAPSDRQDYVAAFNLTTKPTKKQIRKLRRKFRKEIKYVY